MFRRTASGSRGVGSALRSRGGARAFTRPAGPALLHGSARSSRLGGLLCGEWLDVAM